MPAFGVDAPESPAKVTQLGMETSGIGGIGTETAGMGTIVKKTTQAINSAAGRFRQCRSQRSQREGGTVSFNQ